MKYSPYSVTVTENVAVNETSITAKYSPYSIIQKENFAGSEILTTAKYSLHYTDTKLYRLGKVFQD